jgi:hypothetical protein
MLGALDQIPISEELTADPNVSYPPVLLTACVWNQSMLLRVRELAHAVVNLYEANSLVAAAILTRCLLETVALHYHIRIVLTDAVGTFRVDRAIKELWRVGLGRDSRNLKMLFGSALNPRPGYKAVEVEKFAKDLTQLTANSGALRYAYSELSEYVHPNAPGTSEAYARPNVDRLSFAFANDFAHVARNVAYVLEFALACFSQCWSQVSAIIPEFVKACKKTTP